MQMAIVNEAELKADLQKKQTKPVYILFGDDAYLKKFYSEKIAKLITDTDDIFNYSTFEANADLQEVYDCVMQFPFASDKKFVEICDFDFEKASKTDFDKLCSLISEVPDTACLVLRFDSYKINQKKSSRFKKMSSECEKNGGMAVLLNHRTQNELIKMLVSGALKRGCRLDTAAAKYLTETAGSDINILKNELSKLCFYTGSGEITKSTVDLVCVKTVEANIYNLSSHIISCDMSGALACLSDLFYMRIEPFIILSTVSSVYTDMFRVLCAKKSGLSNKAVIETFSYKGKEFLLTKSETNLRKYDLKKLSLCLNELCRADLALKSFSANGQTVLEQLIVKLIYITAKGEALD